MDKLVILKDNKIIHEVDMCLSASMPDERVRLIESIPLKEDEWDYYGMRRENGNLVTANDKILALCSRGDKTYRLNPSTYEVESEHEIPKFPRVLENCPCGKVNIRIINNIGDANHPITCSDCERKLFNQEVLNGSEVNPNFTRCSVCKVIMVNQAGSTGCCGGVNESLYEEEVRALGIDPRHTKNNGISKKGNR